MKIKYISWLPAVIIMILIFSFSAKTAPSSNESSLTVSNFIIDSYEKLFDHKLTLDQREQKLDLLNYLIRKMAHGTEYALLAVAIAFHFIIIGLKGKKRYLLSIVLAAGYAATDEFHQLFVAGRSGEVKDVLIDTTGAVIGILILSFFLLVRDHKKNRQKVTP